MASRYSPVWPATVRVHQSVGLSLYPHTHASLRATGEVQEVEERSQGPGGITGVSAHCVWPCDCPGLVSCSTELVVAESVVVIKKLLQMQPAQHGEIIKHLAKLTDNIQVRGRPLDPSPTQDPPRDFKTL